MNHPKVSVVIPVYGVETFIEQCTVSLFEQTLCDMEFIFVDDCTPDRSIEIVRSLTDKYKDRLLKDRKTVRIERMPQNSGLAAVRKYGITRAEGEYVITCDSDDWVETSMYETLYDIATREQADMVVCDHFINYESHPEEVFHKKITDTDKIVLLNRVIGTWELNYVWCALAHRSLYQKIYFPMASQTEDKIFMVQLYYYSAKTVYTPQPLYHYRIRENSISHSAGKESMQKRFEQASRNWEVMKKFLDKERLLPLAEDAFKAYTYRIKKFLLDGLHDESFRQLWKNSHPDLSKGLLFNPYLDWKEKYRYVRAVIKVYLHF